MVNLLYIIYYILYIIYVDPLSSAFGYHLVMPNIAMENQHFFVGKPSISMGHLYQGELLNNQRVKIGDTVGWFQISSRFKSLTVSG